MMETEMLQNNTTHYKLIRMKHPRRMSRKTSLVHMQTHMRKQRFEQTPFVLSLSLSLCITHATRMTCLLTHITTCCDKQQETKTVILCDKPVCLAMTMNKHMVTAHTAIVNIQKLRKHQSTK